MFHVFSKGTSTNESSSFSFSTIRPFPRVEQNQETIRQTQRKKSRIGRTRILTNTPEKNAIEEEYKKKEKENKKKSTKSKRCLIPEKGKELSQKKKNEEKEGEADVGSGGCFRLANTKPKKGKNLRQKTKNKENDDEDDDGSDGCYTFNESQKYPCVTRSGRSVHRPIRTNV